MAHALWDPMADRPPTKGRRFLRLASMTAGVARDYAANRVRSALGASSDDDDASMRREAGRRIAHTLGELKGAAMKVGQMASAAKELVPPEVAEQLARLQREAPPMPYEVIAEQIDRELGFAPELLFQRFDPEPFAAASVGQVHRATTDDGREVVVKVQYPGVDGAIDSDLAQVKLALRMGGVLSMPRDMVDAVFAELRERLHEELDYCNEADNVRRFRAFHQRHPWIVVPDVVGERSSKRVLTLTYEPGLSLHDIEGGDFPQALRDTWGARVAQMIVDQIFDLHWIHGDPNPANFAFREDGALVVYDFGCVKFLPEPIVEGVRRLIRAARDRDYAGLDEALIALGPLRPEGAPLEPRFYDRWLHAMAGPLYADGPYDFGAATMGEDLVKIMPSTMKRMHRFQPAPELAILDREVAGLYDIAKAMGARIALRAMLEPRL